MRIKMWGVRGSIPTPGPRHRRVRRQHELLRGPRGRLADHPRRRHRPAPARPGAPEADALRGVDVLQPRALGPHPGLPVLHARLRARQQHPPLRRPQRLAHARGDARRARWTTRASPSTSREMGATMTFRDLYEGEVITIGPHERRDGHQRARQPPERRVRLPHRARGQVGRLHHRLGALRDRRSEAEEARDGRRRA